MLTFSAQFLENGLGKTGLTVTCSTYDRSGNTISVDQSATEIAYGVYKYDESDNDAMWAIFNTAYGGVDAQQIAVYQSLINLDTPISGINPTPLSQVYLVAEISQASISLSGMIKDFYVKTTVKLTLQITSGGVGVDVTSDTIKIMLKKNRTDADADAIFNLDAATKTTGGVVTFTIPDEQTDVDPGKYYIEIDWTTFGGEEYVLYSSSIKALDKVKE